MPIDQRSPRISWISGVVHASDAISETLLAELEALTSYTRKHRRHIDAKVFCRDSDIPDTRIQVFDDWRAPLSDPHFQTSDLYIFHFGVFNEIHDLMNLVRRDAKVIVWFHNITPPQYLPPEAEELVHKSFSQIGNFRVADRILVNSRHTEQVLAPMQLGVPIEVRHLFGANSPRAAARSVPTAREVLRLFHSGRFVPSKSVHTLLEAVALMCSTYATPIELALYGMSGHSDPKYLAELRALAAALPAGASCEIVLDAPAERLQRAMLIADALVMPSRHEGFGMPVIEAFAAGTPVVCSTSGALPEVANGLALHFPSGEPEALAARLEELATGLRESVVPCTRGRLAYDDWRSLAARYAQTYSQSAYVDRFVELLHQWTTGRGLLPKGRAEALERWYASGQVYAAASQVDEHYLAAALASAFVASVKAGLRLSLVDGLRALLQWPFPGLTQSEHDLSYWSSVVESQGLRGLVRHLASSPEVRQHPDRLQLARFIVDAFKDEAPEQAAGLDPNSENRDFGMKLKLLAGSEIPHAEFVRQVYRLVLQREHEEAGLGAYFDALRDGSMTRHAVILDVLGSLEARNLLGPDVEHVHMAYGAAA
jgi:glycosyltransferase involved in cell wall biosynthesis